MRQSLAIIAVCVALNHAPATAPRTIFEDQFEGSLGEGWRWLRENPEAWRFDAGALAIRSSVEAPTASFGREVLSLLGVITRELAVQC